MKTLIIVLLCTLSLAAATTISGVTVPSTGRVLTGNFSGTYTSGATTSCLTLSGSADPQFNGAAVSVSVTVGSAAFTATAAAPGYVGETLSLALATAPGCAIVTSAGTASASTAVANNNSEYRTPGDAFWVGKISYSGSPLIGTDGNGYPLSVLWNSPGGFAAFGLSAGSEMDWWTYQGSNALTLRTDGAVTTRTALSAGATYTETAFTGLTSGHSYQIGFSGTGAARNAVAVEAIRCSGCTFTAAPATLPLFSICGASVADITGGGAATANGDKTHWQLLSTALGYVAQGFSASGQDLYLSLETTCPTNVITATAVSPDFELSEADSNDLAHTVSLAHYQAAGQNVVTSTMANGHAPGKLFVIAPNITANLNTTVGNCVVNAAACYASYTAALAAGVAAAASANTVFIPTVSLPNGGPDWLNAIGSSTSDCVGGSPANADLQSDGLHPCAATAIGQPGYGKFANRYCPLAAGVKGFSFTSAGPSSGTGSISQAMTLAGGCTWQDVITITSSNNRDTVCLAGFCGTGTVVLPASLGINLTSVSVNGSAGTRTLTFSGAATGWVIPAPMTITLAAATKAYIG